MILMARKRRKKTRIYFNKACENAIVKFNNSDDPEQRERLFKEYIEYPFNKLSENIINRFNFPYLYDSTENIQREVVSFLVKNIGKYVPTKGRAFSYFSVIAKNHLILKNTARYEYLKAHKSIDNTDMHSGFDIIDEEKLSHVNDESREFVSLMLKFWENNLTIIFRKKKDIDVANAILELFRRAENIENFNKKGKRTRCRNYFFK